MPCSDKPMRPVSTCKPRHADPPTGPPLTLPVYYVASKLHLHLHMCVSKGNSGTKHHDKPGPTLKALLWCDAALRICQSTS